MLGSQGRSKIPKFSQLFSRLPKIRRISLRNHILKNKIKSFEKFFLEDHILKDKIKSFSNIFKAKNNSFSTQQLQELYFKYFQNRQPKI